MPPSLSVEIGDNAGTYSELIRAVNKKPFNSEVYLEKLEAMYNAADNWLKKKNPDMYGLLNSTKTRQSEFL